MTTLTLLLSTFEGAAFLPDQLASFSGQTFSDWTLLWRDDGSTDASPEIVRKYASRLPPDRAIELPSGERLGVTASFLTLLRAAAAGTVAFADQDDVWLPEKLARGMAALSAVAADTPALYCARQVVVDSTLQRIGLSPPARQTPEFPHSLTQNVATGCTVMLNDAAVRLIASSEPPSETLHDWWALLVVTAAGGCVLIDDRPTVLYRQHGANLVGAAGSSFFRGMAALRRGPAAFMTTLRAHVHALHRQPHLLTAANRAILSRIADGLDDGIALRLRALRIAGLKRQTRIETQLFRLWFMIG